MRLLFFVFCLWAIPSYSKEYVIRYQTLSGGSLFHVETKEGETLGQILRQKNPESSYFCFVDAQDIVLASGQTVLSENSVSLSLSDNENQQLGGFVALINNLYPTEYHIFNRSQEVYAKGYMNWVGSSFSFAEPEQPQRYLATFFRPFFKLFNDNWHIEVIEEDALDWRILCILGAFQTACDLNLETKYAKN